jgi:GntR family transcriptional regulator, N-acetylglucosamine utilization regulator
MESTMTGYALERGPVPLYHQVYVHLVAALGRGEWKRGDQIPTERELARSYGCSLITIRRALDELAREGRLERTRGRGTFVTEPPIVRDLAAHVGFADEVRAMGYEPYAVVESARREPAIGAVAESLAIKPGTAVWYLERVRGADGMPLLLEQVRLPADRLPGLFERHDFSRESLWDVLRTEYALPVARHEEVLSAIVPTAREARLLGLRARRPTIQFDGVAFATDGQPIEAARTLVSPDRARYFVELSGARIRSVTPIEPPRGRVFAR